MLAERGCDLLFAPDEKELYPEAQSFKVLPDPALADILEGHFRPGFFVGVCTVVMKLLSCVQPDVTVFGQKDYQQWRVIERMVRQFALPIEVVGVTTCRAEDGLALSSRNGYLSSDERQRAAELSAQLRAVATALSQGAEDWAKIEMRAQQALQDRGWVVDYLTVRQRHDLLPPQAAQQVLGRCVVLAAARMGNTRLLDNLEV